MAFLTTEVGHINLAKMFVENNEFWLARGTLPPEYEGVWDLNNVPASLTAEVTEVVTKTDSSDGDPLSNTPVYDIVSVKAVVGGTTVEYIQGTDFVLTGNNIIWNNNAPETDSQYTVVYRYVEDNITELLSEIDCMKASVVSFCNPDDEGIIEAGGQRWTATRTPSKYVYLFFKYPADISLGKVIYQCGVFTNRVVSGEETTKPVLSENVTEPGDMILIDNIAPFTQSELIRQYCEIVLEF